MTDKDKFNPTAIAAFVLNNMPMVTTMEPELMFAYSKKDGYWRNDKVTRRLKQALQGIIPDVNQYKVKEVIETIKRMTYKDWKPIDTTQNLVALKNGILDIETGACYIGNHLTFGLHDTFLSIMCKILILLSGRIMLKAQYANLIS